MYILQVGKYILIVLRSNQHQRSRNTINIEKHFQNQSLIEIIEHKLLYLKNIKHIICHKSYFTNMCFPCRYKNGRTIFGKKNSRWSRNNLVKILFFTCLFSKAILNHESTKKCSRKSFKNREIGFPSCPSLFVTTNRGDV